MFGKPEWFKKVGNWGLVPATAKGWLYALAWAGILVLPTMLIWWKQGVATALIWVGAAVFMALWESRTLLSAMESEARKNLFYIGEDEGDSKVATRNFDLHVRE